MLRLMEKFINNLKHCKGVIKTWHQRILQITEEDLENLHPRRNPYQMFLDWLLEVVIYGTLSTFVLYVIFKLHGIARFTALSFAIGVLRWLVLDIIGDIKNKISN